MVTLGVLLGGKVEKKVSVLLTLLPLFLQPGVPCGIGAQGGWSSFSLTLFSQGISGSIQ